MLLFVPERPRHAAAARVEVDHFRARNAPQEPQRRLDADKRTLMAVGVDENALGTGTEGDGVTG